MSNPKTKTPATSRGKTPKMKPAAQAKAKAEKAPPTEIEQLRAQLSKQELELADAYLEHGASVARALRAIPRKVNYSWACAVTRRGHVRAYVDACLRAARMTPDELAARLENLAVGDFSDFMSVAPTSRSYWVPRDEHEGLREVARRAGRSPADYDQAELIGVYGAESVASNGHGDLLILVREEASELVIDWARAEERGAISRLKKVKVGKDGQVEFEQHDPARALELLGKAVGMFTERVEVNGHVGVKVIGGISEEDL